MGHRMGVGLDLDKHVEFDRRLTQHLRHRVEHHCAEYDVHVVWSPFTELHSRERARNAT